MRKEKRPDNFDAARDHGYPPRSAASSRHSGRALTPLPQIQGHGLMPESGAMRMKLHKGRPSMQEAQRLAVLQEHSLQRSSLHHTGCDPHVPFPPSGAREAKIRAGMKHGDGRRKKRMELEEILEGQEKMAEVSHGRAMFNRNNDALPSIGQTAYSTAMPAPKLPRIEEPGINDNVLEIIGRHEPRVRLTCTLRDIGQEYMQTAAKDISPPPHVNNAPEIILRNEAMVGKAYGGISPDEYAKLFEETMTLSRSRSRSRSRVGSGASNGSH